MKKKIIVGVIILFIGIQFIRIDKSLPPVNQADDFMTVINPNEKIKNILKTACYDCHSDEIVYPWYSNIAPISWWVKDHINNGKKHLNFSIFGTYPPKRANHKLEECFEMLENNEMPLPSYTWMHPEAKLSNDDREMLISWFKKLYETTKVED
jgi:hypothetical protein